MYLCNCLSRAAYTLRAVFCWGLPGLPDSFPHGNSPSSFSVTGVWEGWLPRAHPGFEVTRKPGMLLDHGKNPFCGGGQARRMFSATKNAKLGAGWCPPHPGLDSPLELSVPGSNVPFLAKPVWARCLSFANERVWMMGTNFWLLNVIFKCESSNW